MSYRKSGVNVDGYPNYIAPYNLQKLSERHHPMGAMPQYPKHSEPNQWFEEEMASERYKYLVDEWCRVTGKEKEELIEPGAPINRILANTLSKMLIVEKPHIKELLIIAENTIREYFDLDSSEILFDLEILSFDDKVADYFDVKKGSEEVDIHDPEFKADFRDELIRRRLTNALMQGASLKGHYIFHLAADKLNALMPDVTKLYAEAMITNDLNYYYVDDIITSQMTEKEQQSGMNEVDFSGEVPVVRVKAYSFTLLIHEMILGVVEMLTAYGLPRDEVIAKEVIDMSDTVLNEFWDIRLGPIIWERFYGLLDMDQHSYLKHAIVGVSMLPTLLFLEFIESMLGDPFLAKSTIDRIIINKKHAIMEYNLNEKNKDEDLPDIDWASLGI